MPVPPPAATEAALQTYSKMNYAHNQKILFTCSINQCIAIYQVVIIFMLYGCQRPLIIVTGSMLGLDCLDSSQKHGKCGFDRRYLFACMGARTLIIRIHMSGFKDVSCLLTLFLKPGYFLKRWYLPLLSSFLTSFYPTITKNLQNTYSKK